MYFQVVQPSLRKAIISFSPPPSVFRKQFIIVIQSSEVEDVLLQHVTKKKLREAVVACVVACVVSVVSVVGVVGVVA
jgi:hypothetical protein